MSKEELQWYPGHMKKADRQIKEKLDLIDTVIEVLDARATNASRNPDIKQYTKNKKHLIVLNKADLADPAETKKWIEKLKQEPGVTDVIDFNALNQKERKRLVEKLTNTKKAARLKCLVVGIPNVGKSAIINSLIGKKKTKTGNKPGVTKAQQWLKTNDNFWLLDTPGILWPKFDDQIAAEHLAWIGSISDKRFEVENIAGDVVKYLVNYYPDSLKQTYNIDFEDEPAWMIFEKIADSRNLLIKGGEYDYKRTSEMILNDFRNGKIGRVTIERA